MPTISDHARNMADRVERFVRETVIPYEHDPRRDHHGAPLDAMVQEMRDKARTAGVLTPHIRPDGTHLSQLETALVLRRSGLSPLGPLAVNTMAPDEGNMYLLGHIASPDLKERFGAREQTDQPRTAASTWQSRGLDEMLGWIAEPRSRHSKARLPRVNVLAEAVFLASQ